MRWIGTIFHALFRATGAGKTDGIAFASRFRDTTWADVDVSVDALGTVSPRVFQWRLVLGQILNLKNILNLLTNATKMLYSNSCRELQGIGSDLIKKVKAMCW